MILVDEITVSSPTNLSALIFINVITFRNDDNFTPCGTRNLLSPFPSQATPIKNNTYIPDENCDLSSGSRYCKPSSLKSQNEG